MSANSPQKMPRFDEWIKEASAELQAAGNTSARLDSELILSHTINKSRSYLHGHGDEHMTDRQYEIANARLALRLDHVPVAYIIGHKEFYGRRFHVTTATLIPRPESEIMIDLLKEYAGDNASLLPEDTRRLIDVGTGSGALGITAKLELPELDVTLSDISRHALTVAAANSKSLQADVHILQGDLLDGFPFQADFILANLPYVDPSWEHSPELDHEPEQALYAKNGGKSVIFRLLERVTLSMKNGGYLFIEADPEQHRAIIQKASQSGLHHLTTRDYQMVFRHQDVTI